MVSHLLVVLLIFSRLFLFIHSCCVKLPTNNRRQDYQFDRYHDRQMVPVDANIARPTGSHFYHYLRLIWNEQDLSNEYTLRYNTTRRGFWISSAPQKGKLYCLSTSTAGNSFNFHFSLCWNRNHDRIELWSIHWYGASDESRWPTHGIDILRELAW